MLSRPLAHVCITYKRTKDSRFETLVLKFEAHTFYHPNTTKRPASGASKSGQLCLRVTPYENRMFVELLMLSVNN